MTKPAKDQPTHLTVLPSGAMRSGAGNTAIEVVEPGAYFSPQVEQVSAETATSLALVGGRARIGAFAGQVTAALHTQYREQVQEAYQHGEGIVREAHAAGMLTPFFNGLTQAIADDLEEERRQLQQLGWATVNGMRQVVETPVARPQWSDPHKVAPPETRTVTLGDVLARRQIPK